MKRIHSVFELFVLVIICDLSVANPPMWGGGGSSSSSAAKKWEPCIYGLESIVRGSPPDDRTWRCNPRIYIDHNECKLLGANNEPIIKASGRNTYLAFFLGKNMKIREADNFSVEYHLDFEEESEANLAADQLLSADSARYKKCTGSNAYKLEKLYKNATASTPASEEENLCIFKVRQSVATAFVIRRMAPVGDQPSTLCVFHALMGYELGDLQNEDKKLELRLYLFPHGLVQTYVLETPKPGKLREFFSSIF